MNPGGRWAALGAVTASISIALSAFGTHSLREKLDAQQLGWWQTGTQYLLYSAFGLLLVGLAASRIARPALPALVLWIGGLAFSGSLLGLALGGPRFLGAVAPFGGSLLIAGFAIFAVQLWRGEHAS
ncbi:MAG: DUF423 domain-containing protein [Fimbriimonadaceae bacterium]|nr:DUF423 domain-containing protein [Fimbriimonadaceae bacterium]